ncbi:MAG TPA: YdeI/OmpD-associated family protein [Chitinophagaceae bacterium]|nr:YdeI/OmpD-associated family protein [Chitinophagaceae bacterium]MCC6633912.1 YdeI/OmpD-associated family protein [Chitinophagaceae bacterium]HNE93423.1 YdeI/OmpD-associated family protein [Chitinophagaceae bacterium]HNF29411.1 YdeI/OmpD-associated family protein [Chitinophagaceae bacterium]HNJ58288.1 YdeI/OmpD-associated family protein [Chitinophagaceae bacterium]
MSNLSLFEKLTLQDEKNLLIQGVPSGIEKQFSKLSYAKNVTPLLKIKKVDFALVFAVNKIQLNNVVREVLCVLRDNSKFWIACPKPTSKIVSDLNRDCSWDVLKNNGYERVETVDIDHMWSAVQFKRNLELPIVQPEPKIESAIAFEKSLIHYPIELERIFAKHKNVKDFFVSLPTTNQKEYLSWIQAAKRADTRQRRLDVVLEKLMAGKKKPSEK